MRKRRVVGRIYRMKYSWKGHKDTRNRRKNRKKKEWASSVGLYQKCKPQRPHHVTVSPRGPQNKAFWKLTHGTMGTSHLQNIHFLKTKQNWLCFCRELMFWWDFQLHQNTGNQLQSDIIYCERTSQRYYTFWSSQSENQLWCKQCTLVMVDIDETSKQNAGIY